MALAILGAMGVCLALLLVLARYGNNPAVLRARFEARGATAPEKLEIDPGRLRFIVNELLERMGLRVVEAEPLGSDGATRLVAMATGLLRDTRYIIYLDPCSEGAFVDAPTLLALAQDVAHNDASLGVVVTPHEIDRSGVAGLAVDLELIDGRALLALVNEHLPAHTDEMLGYRLADGGMKGWPSHLYEKVSAEQTAGVQG